ncbi:putative transmembrane protein [Toxoplasma gondii VEG]|uniref:Putative transmembrane protein n=2 Tax=Toxoplasma gondii TaxID=5811 RepID=B9QJS3_TOXGV|nr:putative transmembrane protein [Toxoplasma gondii VEG]KFG34467.1 putative transmembrane protein [Toxoplasma gondii p89]CEL73235.1 TPA: hypothetical protein BN1205_104340 [Toxoplasma gondii VEG]
MAKDKRGSCAKRVSSSAGPEASFGFAAVTLSSSLLSASLAATDTHPFGLVVTASPQNSSSGSSPALPVIMLPPASPLSSDAKSHPVKVDFFSFHKSLAASATASELLCRRLPRQAALALRHLPGGCSIPGLWMRVRESDLEEVSESFATQFSISALSAAFSSLAGPSTCPAFFLVLLLPVCASADAESRSRVSSGSPRCLVFAAKNAGSAAPATLPVTLVTSLSSSLSSLSLYVSVVPLCVEIAFSPTELLAEIPLRPENVAGLLAAELSLALEEWFDGPVLYVEEAGGGKAGETQPPRVISDKDAFSLPPSPCRLAYLLPLLPSRVPLRFALSSTSCSRLASLAAARDCQALHASAPSKDPSQVVAIDGTFVATALGSLTSPASSLSASPLSLVCSALCADLAVSFSRRLVQSLSDFAETSPREGGSPECRGRLGARTTKTVSPLAFTRRQFFWTDELNRVRMRTRLSEKESRAEGMAGSENENHEVPLLLSDANAPAADESEDEEDLEATRDTFAFLLGVPNPAPEGELHDGTFPGSLLSVAHGSDGVPGERGSGKESCRDDEFWTEVEATMGGNANRGRGKRAGAEGSESVKTIAVVAAVLGALVAFLAAALLFLPQVTTQQYGQEDL